MGVEPANYRNDDQYNQMEDLDIDYSDSDLVSHVRLALQSASTDDHGIYSELIGLLHYNDHLKPDEVAMLVTSLKAISGAVSCIDTVHHGSLLDTIFNMSMWSYGTDVMDALIELIISLAASKGKYLDSCLDMLVCNFTPPKRFVESLKLPYGVAKKDHVLNRVHSALEYIASLVPIAPSRLLPIVLQRMPKVINNVQLPVVVMFVENMFKLESSAIGELVGGGILIMAVVDLLIDFDVEIGWDDILEENPPHKGIFEMELEDEQILYEEDDDDDDGGEFLRETSGQRRLWKNHVSDKLEKLDNLMFVTFEHLKYCKENGRLVEAFETLLESFRKTVLNAYKSKFAQFVIFYACSLEPEICGTRFAEFLADRFVDSSLPLATRMSAVAYLASYMSRGRFLSTSLVVNILARLAKWCSDYCRLQNGNLDPKAHRLFYAGCQAIIYVLCFRLRTIIDVPHLKSQISGLPLKQILMNPLEPLKVCLPSIVEEFVQQAKSAHLLHESWIPVFHDMLESEYSKAFGGIERLDMFFPFDPCLLRKSDSFIRPNFVYWSMVQKTYEDDEGSSDEDVDVFYPDMMNTAASQEAGIAESFEEDEYLDEFSDTLNKMSITPRDSTLKKFGHKSHTSMQMPSRLRPSMSPESFWKIAANHGCHFGEKSIAEGPSVDEKHDQKCGAIKMSQLEYVHGCNKRRKRSSADQRVFRFKSFCEPGYPAQFDGPFWKNVKSLLEFGNMESIHSANGMISWSFQLEVHRHRPEHRLFLFVIEEPIEASIYRYCRHCRYIGWGQHMICNMKYHFVVPSKETAAMASTCLSCQGNCCADSTILAARCGTKSCSLVELEGHTLHGVFHCNGFGHLLCVNGLEMGSDLTGNQESEPDRHIPKERHGLRLLHGLAYGGPWFSRWDYKFGRGSFGVTESMYQKSIQALQNIPLCLLFPSHKSLRQLPSNHILKRSFQFMLELRSRLQKRHLPLSCSTGNPSRDFL
ncbi:PHD finger protein MALE STERILITY 1 [Bienertia sinuspersici]